MLKLVEVQTVQVAHNTLAPPVHLPCTTFTLRVGDTVKLHDRRFIYCLYEQILCKYCKIL